MIAWLNPLALAGLAAVAVPILIHLLRQPHAVRVPFPTLKFVQPSRTAAARMRRLDDPWLLLVRTAIVALAVLALAQPVVMTPGRIEAWNARTARATVIDTSASMERGGAAAAAQARAAAEANADAAFAATIIETPDLASGLARASAWLRHAPPSRREVVVISDFQHGAMPSRVAAIADASSGFRAVQVGTDTAERRFTARPWLGGGEAEVHLTGESTRVTMTPGAGTHEGLRFLSADAADVDALVRAVTAAGTPSADPAQPLAFAFRGAGVPDGVQPIKRIVSGWMLPTVVRLAGDRDLRRAAAAVEGQADEAEGPGTAPEGNAWFDVVVDGGGRPLVRAAVAGGELVIDVAAGPREDLAAAALRGALLAREGGAAHDEEEVVRAPASELAALERAAPAVGREAVRHSESSDARWLWGLALLLLGVETLMRRPRPARASEAREHAA